MENKQQAPAAHIKQTRAYNKITHKGKKFFLNPSEYRLFSLLVEGNSLATFDIAERLNIPDPRSTIRYMRKMGICISDYWCREKGLRFKRYFIHGEEVRHE